MHYVCSLENVKYTSNYFKLKGEKRSISKFKNINNLTTKNTKHGKKTRNHLNKMKDQKNLRNESKNQADLGNNASTLVSTK